MARQLGVLNRGGVPLMPGHGGSSRVYSGNQLAPELSDGPRIPRPGGMPMGYGAQAAPSSTPSNMTPGSPDFDPSARTRTQSSYNFRASVLNNSALAKAKSAATAEARATQRAQAGVQGPAELAAAAGAGVPIGGMGGNGDYAGETASPMGMPSPAVGRNVTVGNTTYQGQGGGNYAPISQHVASPAEQANPGAYPTNPYAGFQRPGTVVPQQLLPPGAVLGQNMMTDKGTAQGFARSGLDSQGFVDRQNAMDKGQGRIHAVLPPDMAANLTENAPGRDDQRIRLDPRSERVSPGYRERVVDRYVGPGVPAGYGPIQQAQDMATARYGEAQAAGQNALAGNPDPLDRQLTAQLAGAQADALHADAAGARDDARENATLRRENRLYQEQGGRARPADPNNPTAADVKAAKESNDPELDNLVAEHLKRKFAASRAGQQPAAGAQPGAGAAAGNKPIDEGTAKQFLQQAGGDKNKARELARAAGYSF